MASSKITEIKSSKDFVSTLQSIQNSIQRTYPKQSNESFAYQFLEALDIDKFKSKLLSMQEKVILVDADSLSDDLSGDCRLCVYRVQCGVSKGGTLKEEVTAI